MEIEVKIRALMMDPNSGTPIIILKDVQSDTMLPIWVGAYEANAIALEIGAPIPPLERVLTQMRLVAYGAATWDWHRLHYEPEYAAARNIPRPIVDGQIDGHAIIPE